MKVEKNKMVAVDYKLTVDGAIADQSQPGAPLEFICGTGMLLPKFEEAILGKEPGEKVAFTLSPKDGYGEVIAEAIVDLPKNTFMVDGKLAEDILFAGSQVPMSDAQGNRMIGTIKEVGEETVKMDFNHPMAGKTLNFEVEVIFSSILQVESLRFSTCFYLPFILLSMLHSIRQFIEALQDPYGLTRTLGEIEVCRSSDGDPLRWVGNSAVVFKIRCGSRYKMLKCYTRPMEHLEAIYQEKLLRQELYVWQADGQGEWCDVVVDDWIEGITLYESVMRSADSGDKAHLSNLARQFDRLALELLESDWAHGDLKPENILLDESGTLRPVDFDAMFLPVFAGEKSPELGTAAYQHPGRTAEDFDASIDDYSIATISTTLHALALEPGLLARYNRGEGLLLSPREIVRHGCAAHAECLALFEKAGDAVRYRIARVLKSPLMRLPNLKPLVRYAVCGPETPADRGELFVRDGLWGFKIGERELIPPIYDAGFDFSEGLAAVRTGRCWHFIDSTGAVAIDCSDCNAVKPFANGRAIVVRDGQRLAIGRKEPRTTLHI